MTEKNISEIAEEQVIHYQKELGPIIEVLKKYNHGIAAEKLLNLVNDLKERSEKTAGLLYETYCTAVGGVAFNGDPLPGWKEFRADPKKKKQSDAWVTTAIVALYGPVETDEEA